mmetsp:Transcript_7764/g.11539  ORF Transcript_7764/g.11539 Transcript_7764/m.11539 type:complete len:264 (-) Transcript_7764:13-804(-)|eukprot:CAMPEP_0185022372 /NCGR_PEP_ID=MMETSP1103-20130426/5092_1 /TAXON_ID=36769 /ORGANISM="Paraphysomonas bandaiensis, Strain Caron Lab Isolate" /LENGTH=263 /DNA_ID=CAMNT_0027554413 /DNA_START=86 /DNA_END=877 /DNA_ORIENTATION=+
MIRIVLNACAPVTLIAEEDYSSTTAADLIKEAIQCSDVFALSLSTRRVTGLSDGRKTYFIDELLPREISNTLDVVYDGPSCRIAVERLAQSECQYHGLLNNLDTLYMELHDVGRMFSKHYDYPDVESGGTVSLKDSEKALAGQVFKACSDGNIPDLKILIKVHGCRIISLKNSTSFTPLHNACFTGQFEVCQWLIANGADVHATANMKMTPLHVAATAGHLNIVEILIENGADPFAEDINGKSPLDKARLGMHYSVVDMISKK